MAWSQIRTLPVLNDVTPAYQNLLQPIASLKSYPAGSMTDRLTPTSSPLYPAPWGYNQFTFYFDQSWNICDFMWFESEPINLKNQKEINC